MTLTRPSQNLLSGIAEVLVELADDVEGLGQMLCGNPELLAKHFDQLQDVDLIAQTARQLGYLLAADTPVDTLADVPLDRLRLRLEESMKRHGGNLVRDHG